jgi:hypothetical protein
MPVITEVTLLTDVKALDTAIDTKIGEVQANPTSNTVLDRLKTIATNTSTASPSNFTVTNSTNVDASKIDLDSIDSKIGNVVLNPTTNTVLDRLKQIQLNTNTSSSTQYNQFYIRPTGFTIFTEIVRPSNATPYILNSIINGTGLSTLPALDFSGLGSLGNRIVEINQCRIISSFGSSVAKMNPIVHLYNSNVLTGSTLTDGTAFNPTYAEEILKEQIIFDSLSTIINHGSASYQILESEVLRHATLDANSKLYFAIINNSLYTPAIDEHIYLTIKGYVL